MHEGIITYIDSVIICGITYILDSDVISYSYKVITKNIHNILLIINIHTVDI